MSSKRRKLKKIKELEAPLLEIKQGTPEWFKAKHGRLSASRAGCVIPGARGYRGERETLASDLAAQILDPYDDKARRASEVKSKSMQRGNDLEPKARGRYELETGLIVLEKGIYLDPRDQRICASPDGITYSGDRLIEIKCPDTAAYHQNFTDMRAAGIDVGHEDFLAEIKKLGSPAGGYYWQMQLQMNCAGVDRCDFVTFDDRKRHPAEQINIIPVYRNDEDIQRLLDEIGLLFDRVDIIVNQRRKLRNAN